MHVLVQEDPTCPRISKPMPQLLSLRTRVGSCNYGSPSALQPVLCNDLAEAAVIKSIPNKKICKKAKWLSEEALQIAEKRRE